MSAHALPIAAEHVCDTASRRNSGHRLRLLSFNIQTGISTRRFRQYFTHSWKHVLPHASRFHNLDRIAELVSQYDLVGLQEADAGSLRSGFINLTEYLAQKAGFPFWYDQTNRRIGRIAKHAIGVLSRFQCSEIVEHKLPGPIPGRGVLAIRYGHGEDSLLVLIIHLALGRRTRLQQLDYVAGLINENRHVVLMGDFNFPSRSEEMDFLINRTLMTEPIHGMNTFPSWRPRRNIDHILVTPTLEVNRMRVLDCPVSDHLPICMEVVLPDSIHLVGA
ncbi:endonuclease/exonuclease/phosphatase family protein [Thiohalobacter sp. IOR34]|uniref:endonuclease/exonuclease/phosphatase family protein n=1 Tax=Thiohalobacter sp. IOR34 TaxID=3057176 RepID=UPI0025B0E6B9|nr:endonuclease/exonuclease/phosphatase family protein [Thiohalobacter sp. IOR34]WJW75459.1 endonuclease/exonuclease/phosphatase family protein [Thiohalobacter sp. IOR34]